MIFSHLSYIGLMERLNITYIFITHIIMGIFTTSIGLEIHSERF